MPLSLDRSRITRAWVVPWETTGPESPTYGVAWVRDDGYEGADLIGTKAEAERVVAEITQLTLVQVIEPLDFNEPAHGPTPILVKNKRNAPT